MPLRSEQFRQLALEADVAAERTSDPVLKKQLSEIAQSWRQLAAEAARLQFSPPPATDQGDKDQA